MQFRCGHSRVVRYGWNINLCELKKILTDRLNELKSELAELKQPKITKEKAGVWFENVSELNIRISEVGKLIQKLN